MIENVLEKVISSPKNYSASVGECTVKFFEKSTGESQEMDKLPEDILVDLLSALGVEAESM